MSDGITIEFGPVERFVWRGMARAGPVDTDWRLRLRVNGEYLPPMDEFHIDGKYNVTLPPYNVIKAGAEFVLSDNRTAEYSVGRIDWNPNDASFTFRRHESGVDLCLTYVRRGFWATVSERAFATELIRSGREYLRLARDEVIPRTLENTKLHEQEAELHREDLDELEALLDDLEDTIADLNE
ncbi:hypothetical protein [Halobacterium jilantaiense]|uniref:Uncharacterized protein n=1 Tax=Halobacterium jilantaiense TaxID=355548 RepID=A0A1I0NPF7_9EURY|nr:hypothetical protein [Halobacterium jilantaiense]SEW03274.1 hypothetical protein SAMN04487945_1040 [Halobacterium jilantaiense]